MGFPLSGAPIFNLIELLVEMQIARKGDLFNHRYVLALLGHPYVVAADPIVANTKRKEILNQNWVSIPKSFLATSVPMHRLIFGDADENILDYLRTILTDYRITGEDQRSGQRIYVPFPQARQPHGSDHE